MPCPRDRRPPRRSRWFPYLLLAALVGLTGCLTSETRIFVHRDGSGTVETVFTLSGPMLQMMMAFGEGEESLCDEDELRAEGAAMGEGVRLESFEPVEDGDRQGCRAVYAFDDINKLEVNTSPGGPMDAEPDPDAPPADEEEGVTFSFTPGSPATLVMHVPQDFEPGVSEEEEEETPADSTELEQQKAMMRAMLEGAHVRMTLEVEGAITETNASHRDGDRITLMEIDFDRLLEDEANLDLIMGPEPQSSTEVRAMLEGVEGIKMETNEQVRIRFE